MAGLAGTTCKLSKPRRSLCGSNGMTWSNLSCTRSLQYDASDELCSWWSS
jgi:hypothetical protein